jgi:hypothetical protein
LPNSKSTPTGRSAARLRICLAWWSCLLALTACAPPPNPEPVPDDEVRKLEAMNRERRFQNAVENGADILARSLTSGVVAVLEFPALSNSSWRGMSDEGHWKSVSAQVRELVTGQLVKQRLVSVVERSQIDQLLKERAYSQASRGLTDEEAARLGKELHADIVALGTMSVSDASVVTVFMRTVNVWSGKVANQAKVGPLGPP